jgi:hypothetical protein
LEDLLKLDDRPRLCLAPNTQILMVPMHMLAAILGHIRYVQTIFGMICLYQRRIMHGNAMQVVTVLFARQFPSCGGVEQG